MLVNPTEAGLVRPSINPNCASRWVAWLVAIMVVGCRAGLQSKPTPYDGMVKQLHAGMTYDSVESRLGKPYLAQYNVGDRVSAIYRVDGTFLPFIVRFQRVESLVIHDPNAQVDSWCAYVHVKESGDSSVLVFTPSSMGMAEQARWISSRPDGFAFPGQAQITDADPNRPREDGSGTKLVLARSLRLLANGAEDSSQIALPDHLNLRLFCHPIY